MSEWSLNRYDGSQLSAENTKTACVVISGWGVNTDIFELVLSGLSNRFDLYLADLTRYSGLETLSRAADALLRHVAQIIPHKKTWLMGWSLGGNIALEMASLKPSSVEGLILLSVNPCFVARPDWANAVSSLQFEQLSDQIESDASKWIRQFDRLQAVGDKKQKLLSKSLREYRQGQNVFSSKELLVGLSWLEALDQRELLSDLRLPVFCLFGEKDVLVPASVMTSISKINVKIESMRVEGAGHMPFLTQPEQFFSAIESFLQTIALSHEKQLMADRFSRAAESYDDFSDLQKIVGHRLIEKMAGLHVPVAIDAGCGTGFFSEQLMQKSQYLVGIDLAGGMLTYSQAHHRDVQFWVQGDIEFLPFRSNSVGAIFSSLAVQWVYDFNALLKSWFPVLSAGGEVFISTLGPRSLYELKTSFERIDSYQHVNPFLSLDEVKTAISGTLFEVVAAEKHEEIIKYNTPIDLMRDLKGIGASLVKRGGAKGLMGKDRLAALAKAYEEYRLDDGLFPATYEVIYLHLRKKVNNGE